MQGQSFVPVWPSRAGPRACPSPLRSTSALRRRRGASPRRAARSSQLRTPGPWARILSSLRWRAAPPPGTFAPARGPPLAAPLHGPVGQGLALRFRVSDQPPLLCCLRVVLLGPQRRQPPARCNLRLGTGGGRVPPSLSFAMLARRHGEWRGTCPPLLLTCWAIQSTSSGAPRRRRGALRPGARAAPRRSALGPWTGTGSPLLPLAISTVRRARGPAGPAAPARRNPRCWDGRGTCPALPGLRQACPSPWGEQRGDVSLPLAFLQCYGGVVLQAHSYHPSWDKQEQSNEALLRQTHCVPA